MTTAPIRVLHVDDDAQFVELAAEYLERESDRLRVATAGGADEALAHLADDHVDCIVSDYDMPGQNGLDLLEAVREDRPDLPFLLFTGKGSEEVAAEAVSAGATDYLQKEAGADQYTLLANRIENAVGQYRAEREADRTRDRLRTVLDQTPDPMFVLDEDMVYRLSNEAHASFHGRTVDEVEGTPADEILPEAACESLRQDVRDVLATGEPASFEGVRMEDAEGRSRLFDSRLLPFEATGSEVRTVLGVAVDVTERTRRERRLRRSQRRFEAVFDSPDSFIGILDPDGRLRKANQAALEFVDAEPADVEGVPFPETPWWSHSEALQEDLRDWIEQAASGEYVSFEAPHYGPDGEEVVADGLLRPVYDEDGEVVSLIAEARDVSERKERERELERHNEWLEEFVGIVSHDLRNPLRVANGQLALAREERDGDHLAAVARAHDRMAALIEDLLALGREGLAGIDAEPVDLSEIARRSWRAVDTGEADLRVETDAVVRADPSRLQQLLENLFRNGVEHGGEDVAIAVGDTGDGFYVEDDGPGIPPDERERVFESGYTTSEEGTGLGLKIVEGIVEAHGWDVRIDGGSRGGARFEFTEVESAG